MKDRAKVEIKLKLAMKERLRNRILWRKRLESLNPNLEKVKRNKRENRIKERLKKQEMAYPEDKLCCDSREPDCCYCQRDDQFASMDIEDERHFTQPWYLCFNRVNSNLCCQRTLMSMVVIFLCVSGYIYALMFKQLK